MENVKQKGRLILGKEVKRLRNKKNIKQLELVEMTGIVRSTIYRLERGDISIKYETLKKILNKMGYKIVFIEEENVE
jgi:transcriptional regulator with XRE-family HTH domain